MREKIIEVLSQSLLASSWTDANRRLLSDHLISALERSGFQIVKDGKSSDEDRARVNEDPKELHPTGFDRFCDNCGAGLPDDFPCARCKIIDRHEAISSFAQKRWASHNWKNGFCIDCGADEICLGPRK